MSRAAVIVPARLASTRFPQKLLYPIQGKPLVLWVAERIRSEAPEYELHFAVDDRELEAPLVAGGYSVVMTSPDHPSGTDRIAEANRTVGADIVVNVQGDEPLVNGNQIRQLDGLIRGGAGMATLATRFRKAVDFLNPNQVKVVFDSRGRALYFSRSGLPFCRDRDGEIDDDWIVRNPVFRHLGLYAYTAGFLARYSDLEPGRLERIEKLEQLRVLERGFDIQVGETDDPGVGVDTPEDADRFEKLLG